jgi:hypothetical protein
MKKEELIKFMKDKNVTWIEFQKQYPNVKCSSYQFYDSKRLSKGLPGYHKNKKKRQQAGISASERNFVAALIKKNPETTYHEAMETKKVTMSDCSFYNIRREIAGRFNGKRKYSKIITTQTLDRINGNYTDKELALAVRIIQNVNRAPGQKIKFSLYRESDMVSGDKTIKLESTI